MKKLLCLLALSLALILPHAARAESKQITSLNNTATQVFFICGGQKVTIVTISIPAAQTNGINMTYDGGSSAGGADPGTGTSGGGLQVLPGQTVSFYGPYVQGMKFSAVTQASTTVVNITTNAPAGTSTFPIN